MASRGPRPLRCADLLTRLRRFGITTRPGRGSHLILFRSLAASGHRGPTYPVSCHNPSAEISVPIIRAILRRFEINEAEFWS